MSMADGGSAQPMPAAPTQRGARRRYAAGRPSDAAPHRAAAHPSRRSGFAASRARSQAGAMVICSDGHGVGFPMRTPFRSAVEAGGGLEPHDVAHRGVLVPGRDNP